MTIRKSETYIECDACKCKLATVQESWFGRKEIDIRTQYVEFSGTSIAPDAYYMPVYVKFPLHLCHSCYRHLLNAIKYIKDNSNEKDVVDNSKDS